ncbi:MAG: flavodoxin [Muribaculaceae bacterium]|nr:flavodoxin [Muribaculaceae bacterium]
MSEKKYGIFYGSTTGSTEGVAKKLAEVLNVAAEDVHNIAETSPVKFGEYDYILAGTSTWGSGEVQDDWYDALDGMEALVLKGKKVAVFGCGDENMSDTFCGAVGVLYKKFAQTGAEMKGQFNAEGYVFEDSEARISDDLMCGLVLDEVNKPELTDGRIKEWVKTL